MRRESTTSRDIDRNAASNWWKRMTTRRRDRRRAKTYDDQPHIPGENRLLLSLYDVWRFLWGTHESGAK